MQSILAFAACVAFAVIGYAPLALAGNDLSIDRTSAVAAIMEAAGRIGLPLTLQFERCGENGDNCSWRAGSAVRLTATHLGGPRLTQLEVQWSNSSKGSSPVSGTLYRSLCQAIIAAVRPAWTARATAALAVKLALLRASPQLTVDAEQHDANVLFYGSRNAPDVAMRDFPAEAFVQCGAVATDGP